MIRIILLPRFLPIAIAMLILCGGGAEAHKLKLFASGNGKVITGKAYFPGGGIVPNAKILITAANGKELGVTTTDQEGEFSFEAMQYCDHLLVLESADGHRAEWLVKKEELAESLPTLSSGLAVPGDTELEEELNQEITSAAPAIPAESLLAEVRTLSTQVEKMREELAIFQEEIRFRDILGGVGFLFGISGMAFYFLAKKHNQKPLN